MGDPISLVANIIAVVQISTRTLSLCYRYISAARDASHDLFVMINNVRSLKAILEDLKDLVKNSPQAPSLTLLGEPNGPLNTCELALRELNSDLSAWSDSRNFLKALTWPLKEKSVQKVLTAIEQQKATFILILARENMQNTLAIEGAVTEIRDSLRNTRLSDHQEKVLQWLSSSDPSANHETACSKHEPMTGNWFIALETFNSWKMGLNQFLLLTGIPGCGKTVLCSTIIEHVRDLCCSSNSNVELAYFYFDFNNAHRQTLMGFLRSILVQLCYQRAVLPDEVQKLFDQYDTGKRQPGKRSLISALLSLLRSSVRTYLIIDALDECSDREELLKFIIQLSNQNSASLLATSRKEREIEMALQDVVNYSVRIQSDVVDNDIRRHIQSRLAEDPKLSRWSDIIKEEIETVLVEGSCGM
jgi:hypothetical protein